jgi:hypothetical protein
MHAGMLWFDNSSKTLEDKVKKATEYYKNKYGRSPDLCLVHPSMIKGNPQNNVKVTDVDGMTVRAFRPVLPGHIWIGIEDK